jgi:hypothetical protein
MVESERFLAVRFLFKSNKILPEPGLAGLRIQNSKIEGHEFAIYLIN